MSLDHRTHGEEIKLTQVELDRLPEYSLTIPTGTTVGKRWKRNANQSPGGRPPDSRHPNWWVGEYKDHPTDPTRVNITWRRVRIVRPRRPARLSRSSWYAIAMIVVGLLLILAGQLVP